MTYTRKSTRCRASTRTTFDRGERCRYGTEQAKTEQVIGQVKTEAWQPAPGTSPIPQPYNLLAQG